MKTGRDTARGMARETVWEAARGTSGEADQNEQGKKIDSGYHCVRVIGKGAFSEVCLVEDESGRQYACKISGEVKMLRREAEILAGLYHPLFPAYVGYEENEGTGRLFMEYIPGRNLGQLVRRRGGISPRQAMGMAEELADGLQYLHQRQPTVLYRDLKPDNIMVCEDGHMKLIDLGCACFLEEQGEVKAGTPGFAPPEQLDAGQRAGIYSDVYGLGRTIQSVMTPKIRKRGILFQSGGAMCRERGRGKHSLERKYATVRLKTKLLRKYRQERSCRRRLNHMIEESTREDFRLRPQDMISVLDMLTGKRKMEEGILCEKNIWESSYKNTCSLPVI